MPCRRMEYRAETLAYNDPLAETGTMVYLSFGGNAATLFDESLVFDFNAILSSVGGALGLFLGFSFLGCANALVEWAAKRAE